MSLPVAAILTQPCYAQHHEQGFLEDDDVLYALYVPSARVFRREEIARPIG